MFPFACAVLAAYALFPYFPSEPPRTVFPGQDFPAWTSVFRRFNWGMLGAYSAAFAMRLVLPEKRWVARFLLVLTTLIATATVYGRYHYLADVAAGLALSLAALGLMRLVEGPRRSGLGAVGGLRRG